MILRRCPKCKVIKEEGYFHYIWGEGYLCFTCFTKMKNGEMTFEIPTEENNC